MNDPALIIDLNPYWPVFTQNYMNTPCRLIGPFDAYMVLLVDMFKATHNDTSEDEVLIDNYINGSYLQLDSDAESSARGAVRAGLDVVFTLADVCDHYPGAAKVCVLDMHSRTLLIVFGGDTGAP